MRIQPSGSNMTNKELILTREIQVWIDNVNIAAGVITLCSTPYNSSSDLGASNTVDQDFNGNTDGSTSSGAQGSPANNNIGEYIEISLNTSVSVREIQSIVNYSYDVNRDIGLQIQLINVLGKVIYNTPSISVGKPYYRFDGPLMSIVENTSTVDSSVLIIEPEDLNNIQKWNILDYPRNIRKVRIVRELENSGSSDYSNLISTEEIQVWVGDENVAENGIGYISMFGAPGWTSSINDVSNINDKNPDRLVSGSETDTATNIGEYIELTLNRSYSLFEIQTIVHYNDSNYKNRVVGTRIQILSEYDEILYESQLITIDTITDAYRFNGPAVIPADMLISTTGFSSVKIIEAGNDNSVTEWKLEDYIFICLLYTSDAADE